MGLHPERKGPFVARKRPTVSHARQPVLTCLEGDRPTADGPLLTRAEAAALRRSAPLTHASLAELFEEHLDAPARATGQAA